MTKITKCVDTGCNDRMGCWRFVAPLAQHSIDIQNFKHEDTCNHVIPVDILMPTRKEVDRW